VQFWCISAHPCAGFSLQAVVRH